MMLRRAPTLMIAAALALGGGLALGGLTRPGRDAAPAPDAAGTETPVARVAAADGAAGEAVTADGPMMPPPPADTATTGEVREHGMRILVSLEQRRLWLVEDEDTLMDVPVAIGMGKDFSWNGRRYHFATPKGTRRVIAKGADPIWIVPEWHYYERAAQMGLEEVVKLKPNDRILLGDSSWLVVRGDTVGRINHFGHFAPFTPGVEIIFDGRIFIPPLNSPQRRVPEALGPYKLDMGDGYLIHGTHPYNEESIGQAVSHGCVRMRNEDLDLLYRLVPRGTPVIIF